MKKIVIYLACLVLFWGCKKGEIISQTPTFDKILILGNSITHSKPDASIGWFGDWGMAASAKEKDFVHILQQKFIASHPTSTLDFKNISAFENSYWNYDISLFDEFAVRKHDLLILRIGENVPIDSLKTQDFKSAYIKLINYFQQQNPQIKILCVASFWDQPDREIIMREAANEKKLAFLSIKSVSHEISNTAWGLFPNFGVATHPSDKGMQKIADLIWNKILEDKYFRN